MDLASARGIQCVFFSEDADGPLMRFACVCVCVTLESAGGSTAEKSSFFVSVSKANIKFLTQTEVIQYMFLYI